MDLREETERIILDGYNEANAQAKLCQDIILKAIYESVGVAQDARRTIAELSDEAVGKGAGARISTEAVDSLRHFAQSLVGRTK